MAKATTPAPASSAASMTGAAHNYAVVVDGVEDVATIAASDLTPAPDFGDAVDIRFITGMARRGAAVATLIDLDIVAAADKSAEPPAGPKAGT